MHYKQVANRRKEKWQTGGRDKCHSAAKPIEFLKVWLIRIPRFCVDDSNSVPNLPLPMKNIGKKVPGSFIHKLYGLRSPDPLHKRVGEPDYTCPHSLYLTHNRESRDSTVSGRKECFDLINQLLGWGRPLSV